jgi:hypothetical protein
MNITTAQLETRIGATHDTWTGEHIQALAALGKAIKQGETTVHEEFEQQETDQ